MKKYVPLFEEFEQNGNSPKEKLRRYLERRRKEASMRVDRDDDDEDNDEDKERAASTKYDEVGEFSNGVAQVKLNGKIGIVDKEGNEVVPCKYDNLSTFNFEGGKGTVVNVDNEDILIDSEGNRIDFGNVK